MPDLITPRPGPGVCPACWNFTQEASGLCRACRACEAHLDAIVPISYAAAGSALHRELADYKGAAEPSVPDLRRDLARTLSRFLDRHEACVAAAAGSRGFDLVTVVPSSRSGCDRDHPLRTLVGSRVAATRGRYVAALSAGGVRCVPHRFDRRRFEVGADVAGRDVLLIDDMWTTGANAQSAAAVLREAGAATVAAVVIGRYVNGHWGGIAARLAMLAEAQDPGGCVICQGHPRRVEASQQRPEPAVAYDRRAA